MSRSQYLSRTKRILQAAESFYSEASSSSHSHNNSNHIKIFHNYCEQTNPTPLKDIYEFDDSDEDNTYQLSEFAVKVISNTTQSIHKSESNIGYELDNSSKNTPNELSGITNNTTQCNDKSESNIGYELDNSSKDIPKELSEFTDELTKNTTLYNDRSSIVNPSPLLSDVSSEFDDSDKDITYQPSELEDNEIIENSSNDSCCSFVSEKSCEICLNKSIIVYETGNLGKNITDDSKVIKEGNSNIRADNTLHAIISSESQQILTLLPTVNKTYKKKKTFCKFCTTAITNFERHLERNHSDCKEVLEMLSYPKKSKERKRVIDLLRKEGHFEEYLRGNVRPVYQTNKESSASYYPCAGCKGLYSRKFLSRHHKNCPAVSVNKDFKRIKHLSASQTLIASALNSNNALHRMRVKEEVFDKMKPDEISLIAKSDPLICHFGEQYLKKHNRKQIAVVCSNKMRELARLLIMFREINNNKCVSLSDVINPVMFDVIIECAKKLGGYDEERKTYRSPSLSAHLGTSLKQVSELLIRLLLKKDPTIKINQDFEMQIKEVKRFKELVTSQWTTEISSLAFKTLNENKWNKPTILPLTKDIIKFKDYVTSVANIAVATLKEDSNNKVQFKKLVETTLILTILYNRRRIGDVQYTKLQTYLTNVSNNNQEECLNSLTETEKVLTKQYKRIVTGGKGSKPIVILFPQNLQDYVNIIINIRLSSNLVPSKNPYLFAYPNTELWARGDVAIRKYAQKANLEQPSAISSNKLRKQIATVMQILNLNQDETAQFAAFMGHTEKTHNEFYKLPQDVYQTAKVAKLLILMDKGSGHKYMGKSLNEIDVNPEEKLAHSDNSETEETFETNNIIKPKSPELPNLSRTNTSKQSGRTVWTKEQRDVVKHFFKQHIQLKKAPKKNECQEIINKYPHLLRNKDWVRIKTYVYNTYRTK